MRPTTKRIEENCLGAKGRLLNGKSRYLVVNTAELDPAGLALNALGVDVHKYARHPTEESRLLKDIPLSPDPVGLFFQAVIKVVTPQA